MERRIDTEEFSVGQLAKLSGVSVRTLHHYDEIGLLKPAHVAENGYRIYQRPEAERLQEILFYRSAGMGLAEIRALLAGGAPLPRLLDHRVRLAEGLARQAEMLAAVDAAILLRKGEKTMTLDDLYHPFEAETQAAYEAWLTETYGADMAAAISVSRAHLAQTSEGMDVQMGRLREIEAGLVADYEEGVEPKAVDLSPHRGWVAGMWGKPCTPDAYAGLAETYLAHPDFIARYEALSKGPSQWLPRAMKAYAALVKHAGGPVPRTL